jgi:olefin beta-lactone synthetase
MNCASRIVPQLRDRGGRLALLTERDGALTFREFGELAASAQALARDAGLAAGDSALVLARPGPRLFASVLGLIGIGVTVVFVEPWMPMRDVEHVVKLAAPRAFFGSTLAQLWGVRVRAVRDVERWINTRKVGRKRPVAPYAIEEMDGERAAIVAFTSGTTGRPKGIVRTHRYLWDMHDIVGGFINAGAGDGPDLCLFPNIALLQLGTGRGAVLVPDDWTARGIRRLDALAALSHPETLTCGPAFLLELLRNAARTPVLPSLKSVHVGGALTDRWIFERAFERWPDAKWTHVYGGTEAEPVSHGDARECVRASREHGLFQTLNVGFPIPEIRTRFTPEGLWVSGRNVAPEYLGAVEENRRTKHVDDDGRLWHCMGDRIESDDEGWWLNGRASEPAGDFALEQRLYARLETSKCFIHRDEKGAPWLYGEGIGAKIRALGVSLEREFPEITGLREIRIVRDRRHRARIDRARSLGRRVSSAA